MTRRLTRSVPIVLTACALASCGGGGQEASRPAAPPASSRPSPPSSAPTGGDQPLVLPGDAAKLVSAGIAEYRQGRYHEAAEALAKARDLVPADLRVSTLLGTALIQAKLYTPAQEEFKRILALHPEAVDPRLGLARIGIRLGDFAMATPYFREVLQIDPNNPQALYNLGWLQYRSGDFTEASGLLERVVAVKADLPDAHYTLGLAYVRLGKDERAETEFKKTLELSPQNSQAHFNLAKLYQRAGRQAEAAREQETFQKLWDRQAADRAAEGTARELYLAGHFTGALKEFDRLAELNPASGRFQLGRGLCLLKMGKKDEALAALQKAVQLDPKLPDAHFHLAALYQERGDAARSEQERSAFEALETIGENKTGF